MAPPASNDAHLFRRPHPADQLGAEVLETLPAAGMPTARLGIGADVIARPEALEGGARDG